IRRRRPGRLFLRARRRHGAIHSRPGQARDFGRRHHPPRRGVRLGAAGRGSPATHRDRLLPDSLRGHRDRRRRLDGTDGKRQRPRLRPHEEARGAAHQRAGRFRRRLSSDILLAAVATSVGLLIGTVGVGGVLMVAFLALFGDLSIHQAAATSLFTFVFTGILGTWLYTRRGSIDWGIVVPVCAGAIALGYFGASAAALVDPRPLSIVIALIIVAAGLYVLAPLKITARRRDGRGGSGEQ